MVHCGTPASSRGWMLAKVTQAGVVVRGTEGSKLLPAATPPCKSYRRSPSHAGHAGSPKCMQRSTTFSAQLRASGDVPRYRMLVVLDCVCRGIYLPRNVLCACSRACRHKGNRRIPLGRPCIMIVLGQESRCRMVCHLCLHSCTAAFVIIQLHCVGVPVALRD
jgi:hypothetical protein